MKSKMKDRLRIPDETFDIRRDIKNIYPFIRWQTIMFCVQSPMIKSKTLRNWDWYRFRKLYRLHFLGG